jgi:hypothetical protein
MDVEGDHRQRDMYVKGGTFSVHRNVNHAIDGLANGFRNPEFFVPYDQARTWRVLFRVVGKCVGLDFQCEDLEAVVLYSTHGLRRIFDVIPGYPPMFSSPDAVDSGMRGSGGYPGQENLFGPDRVGNPEYGPHVDGILDVLEKKAEARLAVSMLAHHALDLGFSSCVHDNRSDLNSSRIP